MSNIEEKLRSIQDYPFIIRRELDRIKIYSPDLGVQFSELPTVQKLNKSSRKKYYEMLGVAVLKAWHLGEQTRDEMWKKYGSIPLPSKTHIPTEPVKEKLLTPQEVAERKACHVQTVRRAIDREELVAIITPGGHRKILETQAEDWIKKIPTRKKGRPKTYR